MKNWIFGIIAIFFIACAARTISLKPGIDFPAGLAIFEYILNAKIVEPVAEDLVQHFHLGNPKAEDEEWRHPTVSWPSYKNTRLVVDSIRRPAYGLAMPDYDEDVYSPGAESLRRDFLNAAAAAGKHPAAVRWFYEHSVDAVLDAMITNALKPVIHGEGDRERPAYTSAQIAVMFRLYAEMAEANIPYLRIAAQPLNLSNELHAAIRADFQLLRQPWTQERAAARYAAENRLQEALREAFGRPFDTNGYETWKFGRRRLYNGGSELVETFIELVEDAAKRLRAKADALDD